MLTSKQYTKLNLYRKQFAAIYFTVERKSQQIYDVTITWHRRSARQKNLAWVSCIGNRCLAPVSMWESNITLWCTCMLLIPLQYSMCSDKMLAGECVLKISIQIFIYHLLTSFIWNSSKLFKWSSREFDMKFVWI
jgi:hypothetical protein